MARVIVAMSGGVDSSVAALLLKQQGHEVSGLFMKNWEEDEGTEYCTSVQDLADCHSVCADLDIELVDVNFAAEYWERVFLNFLDDLKNNITPNPDVLCNREIKFGVLWQYAKQLGADYLATGHYASIDLKHKYALGKALDHNKDQSYFLHSVSPTIWKNILFPLANITKGSVRELARKNGIATAHKKDSTGICFIGERKFQDFIDQYISSSSGDIVDVYGRVLGRHKALFHYTLGQRKGIKVGGIKGAAEKSWFVLKKDAENNQLVVHQDEQILYDSSFQCQQIFWQGEAPKLPYKCQVKVRYRQLEQPCTIYLESKGYRVELVRVQRAITPGQYAVFYEDRQCIGGGKIVNVIK